MSLRRTLLLALWMVPVAGFLGCSSSSNDPTSSPKSDGSAGPPDVLSVEPVSKDLVVASLVIPPEFNGSPMFLGVSYFASIPPVGIPVAFGDRVQNPVIVPGQECPTTTSQASLSGQYYITFVR